MRSSATLAVFVIWLVLLAGCSEVFNIDRSVTEEVTISETGMETPAGTNTDRVTQTETGKKTRTEVPKDLKEDLDILARQMEDTIRENYNVRNIQVYRPAGTANITAEIQLPNQDRPAKKEVMGNVLGEMIFGQRVFSQKSDRPSFADNLVVKTDEWGSATLSQSEFLHTVDGDLNRDPLVAYWAGKLEPFHEITPKRHDKQETRAERLSHVANLVESQLENENKYVKNVTTEIHNETLYIRYDRTEEGPNDVWATEAVTYAYYDVVTEYGLAYTPENGMFGYQYKADGGPPYYTVAVLNQWVFEEYTGLKPEGEAPWKAFTNSSPYKNGTHEGPP